MVLAQSNQSYEGSADHFQAALGPHIPSFTPHIYPPPVLLLRELLNNRQHTSCTLALVAPRATHLWARRPSFGRELKPAIYSGKLSGRSCIRVYPLCERHTHCSTFHAKSYCPSVSLGARFTRHPELRMPNDLRGSRV